MRRSASKFLERFSAFGRKVICALLTNGMLDIESPSWSFWKDELIAHCLNSIVDSVEEVNHFFLKFLDYFFRLGNRGLERAFQLYGVDGLQLVLVHLSVLYYDVERVPADEAVRHPVQH